MSLRPTVIGGAASAPVTPAAPLRPTAITPAAPAVPLAPTKPLDTTTASTAAAAATPIPAAAPATPFTATPVNPVTKVLGVERKTLRVDPATLAQRHRDASAAAIDQAVALLAGVVPGNHPLLAIEQLGRAPQEGVAQLVEHVLRIVDDETARNAGRHTERLLDLLGDLAEALRPASLAWLRKPWRQTLAESRPEIDALRGLLGQAESALLAQRDKLDALQDDAGRLLDGLASVQIAVAELRWVFASDARRGGALDSRESDIAKSLALLQSHRVQMQALSDDFTQLAQRIRDAVLHALPAWLSVASAMPHDSLNDTQRFTLLDPLHTLIRNLPRRA